MKIEYSLVYTEEGENITKIYTGTIIDNQKKECFLLEISFIKNKGTKYFFVTQYKHDKKEEEELRINVVSQIRD